MYSHGRTAKATTPMLVSSPRCSFDCQGLSIHLPPLGGRRDLASPTSLISPPMSASYGQQHFDRSSPKIQRAYAKPSDSPPSSRPSTSGKRSPTSHSKGAYASKSIGRDIRADLSTPNSTDYETAATSVHPSSDTSGFRGGSNDDSSNPNDSPEAQQLVPGPPGIARRSKAHVPSACLNCKKKHLACETKRPCNRCVQTGKQSSCVDVQHKKRGRPRLREEETLRGLAFRSEYPTEDLYATSSNGVVATSHSQRHRSKAYRELRSQPESPYDEQRPRTSDANYTSQQIYPRNGAAYGIPTATSNFISEQVPTVILTTDFVVVQHNRALSDALALSFTARGQGLLDLVVPAEKERIRRLQASIQAELRDAVQAAYMNGGPSNHHHSSIPAIEQIDITRVTAGYRTRSEYWTFRLPREQSIGFPISVSLARDGGHFVVLTLVQSATPSQTLHSPPPPLRQPQSYRNGHHHHVLSSASSASLTPSPPRSSHSMHSVRDHANGLTDPYMIAGASPSVLDEQLLHLQASPNGNGVGGVPRSMALPYSASRTDSSGSASSSIPRSSPASSNQPLPHHHLKNLQLPPIRTAPTSEPTAKPTSSTTHASSSRRDHRGGGGGGGRASGSGSGDDYSSRRRYKSGTPSPSRSSPHSTKRKKRRRVDIEDLMH